MKDNIIGANNQELTVLDTEELNKYAGGNVLKITYYYKKEDPAMSKRKIDIYYCPRNSKYYLSPWIATETDKELGGNGEIVEKEGHYINGGGMPYIEDAPNVPKMMGF